MRRPPPLSRLPSYPVTGGTALLAIVATIAWHTGHEIDRLQMGYLAFHGEPWRLITSAFPHVDIFHIYFNLFWLWVMGTLIEERLGPLRTGALYAFLAIGSAAAEYAVFTGGVGLSGVGYGLFGFLWVLSRYDKQWADVVDKQTIYLFVGWFFLCVVLTVSGAMAIGNVAHGTGAVLGALVGWMTVRPAWRRRLSAGALALVLGLIFWAATRGRPLVNFAREGGVDVARLGYEALMRDDNPQALRLMRIATSMRHTDPAWWFNLGIAYQRVGSDEQSEAAFKRAKDMGYKPAAG